MQADFYPAVFAAMNIAVVAPRAVHRFGVGRVASKTDPAGSTTYRYERRGLLRQHSPLLLAQH